MSSFEKRAGLSLNVSCAICAIAALGIHASPGSEIAVIDSIADGPGGGQWRNNTSACQGRTIGTTNSTSHAQRG